jgi:hypothetical protein
LSPTTSPTLSPTDWNECAVNVVLGGEQSWQVDREALAYQKSFATHLVGGLYLARERTKFAFASFGDLSAPVVPDSDSTSGTSSVFSQDISIDKVGIQAQMGSYFDDVATKDLSGVSNVGLLDFIQKYGKQITDASDEYGSLVVMVTGDVPKNFRKRLLEATAESVNSKTIIICVYNNDNVANVPAFFMPSKTPFCDVLVKRQENEATKSASVHIVRNAICSTSRNKLEDPCPSKKTRKECDSVVRNFRGEDRGFEEDLEATYRFDGHCEWNKKTNQCTVTNRHQTLYYNLPDESGPGPTHAPIKTSSLNCVDIVDSSECKMNGCCWKAIKKRPGQCLDPPACQDIKLRNACVMRVNECQWDHDKRKKGKYCRKVGTGNQTE